jgi:hypothetical protein
VNGLIRFQGVWSGGAKIGKNSLFWVTFWGFLGFSEEEKGPHIEKLENFHYSTFFFTHQTKQLWFSEVFPKVHSLGDNQFG